MELGVGTPFIGSYPKIIHSNQIVYVFNPNLSSGRACFPLQMRYNTRENFRRKNHKSVPAISAVSSGAKTKSLPDLEDIGSSSQFEDFSVNITSRDNPRELKVRMKVSGDKTRAIFDDVFSKMVADAQPIPGFRRVKGGKTPNIPEAILLEILGPSKVYKKVIKKVINSTIANYIEKEGLSVGKDLKVEQCYEDLRATFEPGEEFSYDAVVQLQQMD